MIAPLAVAQMETALTCCYRAPVQEKSRVVVDIRTEHPLRTIKIPLTVPFKRLTEHRKNGRINEERNYRNSNESETAITRKLAINSWLHINASLLITRRLTPASHAEYGTFSRCCVVSMEPEQPQQGVSLTSLTNFERVITRNKDENREIIL